MAVPRTTIPLESSFLDSISYGDDGTLEAHLRNGGIYRYIGVPQDVVDALLAADSKGGYFNRNIRDKFQCERLMPAITNHDVIDVQFTPDQREFVDRAIASGRIQRSDDAIQEALTMWVERERDRADIAARGRKRRIAG